MPGLHFGWAKTKVGTEVIGSNLYIPVHMRCGHVSCACWSWRYAKPFSTCSQRAAQSSWDAAILCEWFEQVFESEMIRMSNGTSAHCCVTATELLAHIISEKTTGIFCSGISVTTRMMELTSSSEPASEILWISPSIFLEGTKLVNFIFEGSCQIAMLQDQSNILNKLDQILIKLDLRIQEFHRPPQRGQTNKIHQDSLEVTSISNIIKHTEPIRTKCSEGAPLVSATCLLAYIRGKYTAACRELRVPDSWPWKRMKRHKRSLTLARLAKFIKRFKANCLHRAHRTTILLTFKIQNLSRQMRACFACTRRENPWKH